MDSFLQDIRYGLRGFLRAPGFAVVALLTLAIGIGANTAMFSVLNAVLLRPLPYRDPSRIVALQQSNMAVPGLETTGVSPLEYLDYRERTHAFSAVGGVIVDDMNLTGGSEPQRIRTGRITPSMFDVLGVQPMLGRAFRADEDHYGGPKLVILGYALWQQHFGADRGIVGRTVRLDNMPFEVIGVMPPSFKFPYEGTPFYEPAAVWVPMDFNPRDMQNRAEGYDVQAFARLKPGVTMAQAQQDAEAARNSLQADHRDVYNGKLQPVARVQPMKEMSVGAVRPLVIVLFGAVGFVLLIACANVANLLLVRATAREREIAVRSALGASSVRLARQLLTECVLLGIAGGLGGLAIGYAAVRSIAHTASSQMPRLSEVSMDPAVLAFTFGAAVLTGIIFGLAPALRAMRVEIYATLKANSQQGGAGRGRHRWNNALVVLETAATLVLLLGAGLLINSFVRVLNVAPGFDPSNVLIVRTAFDTSTYPTPVLRNAAKKRMLDQLAGIPGAQQVGATSQLPLSDSRAIGVHMEGEGENEFHMVQNELVSPNYFSAMGVSLLRGRSFTEQDQPGARLAAAVVSDSFARKFWPNQDAVGKQLSWGGRSPFVVVGVVADVRLSAMDAPPPPTIYMSMLQTEGGRSARAVFAIRAKSDAAALIPEVRRMIWSVDPNLPVYDVTTMNGVVSESLAQRRFLTTLLGTFAAIALLLAAVGLYGVLSYSVAQRSREMALRIALGATPAGVRSLVLRGGLGVVGLGIAIGLAGGFIATRLMSKMLFGISAVDPATYATVAALLLGVALAASYVPARRATQVDPMAALRYE
jgi:predicted permease